MISNNVRRKWSGLLLTQAWPKKDDEQLIYTFTATVAGYLPGLTQTHLLADKKKWV